MHFSDEEIPIVQQLHIVIAPDTKKQSPPKILKMLKFVNKENISGLFSESLICRALICSLI